jgi:hypothetical protein
LSDLHPLPVPRIAPARHIDVVEPAASRLVLGAVDADAE